ncbi:unnamed protein product [Polarella glacialis]|uniref:Acyltransferase n=1 Tax=Polarella glacialis TaxID=89957 RepID=A0A813L3J1_POLGL|nr:unnamed protein product [Polarella glacialis]CAE8719834.1 unnamed protein product [Polarella glacialis]
MFSIFIVAAAYSPESGRARAAAGAFTLAVMLAMVTEVPGRPKDWKPWPRFCKLISKDLDGRSYFTAAELGGALDQIKPGKNLFAVHWHPHGILTAGYTWNLFWNFDLHERTGRIGFLCDEGLRRKMPTFRLMCDWYENKNRYADSATKEVIMEAMKRGDSLALLPGGFQEAVICARGKDRVYIKKRAGFVKYCLQHGYRITPVYNFGESDCYHTFRPFLSIRLWLAGQNIPASIMFGNPFCPLLPLRSTSLHSVVGPPLELPQIADPTREQVAEWHNKYMEALTTLFDKHKAETGRPDAVLELW